MNQLTVDLKAFVLEFKAPYRETPRSSIYLTRLQADFLRRELNNKDTRFIDIEDDGGGFVESIDKNTVKGIRKMGKDDYVNSDTGQRYYVCDFGGRHKVGGGEMEECKCEDEFFGIAPFLFKKAIFKKHDIMYTLDITPETREGMKGWCKKYTEAANPK